MLKVSVQISNSKLPDIGKQPPYGIKKTGNGHNDSLRKMLPRESRLEITRAAK